MKIMKNYVDLVTILVKHVMDLIIINALPVMTTRIEILSIVSVCVAMDTIRKHLY